MKERRSSAIVGRKGGGADGRVFFGTDVECGVPRLDPSCVADYCGRRAAVVLC